MEVTVSASTRVGEGSSSSTRLLLTPLIPAAVYTHGGVLRERQGEDITLQCRSVGDPRPSLQWQRRGMVLGETGGPDTPRLLQPEGRLLLHGDGRLVLQDTRREDSGNYTCTATNQHGSDSVSHALTVLGEPD